MYDNNTDHVPSPSENRKVALALVKHQQSILRALEHILSSDTFIEYYNNQPEADKLIADRNLDGLRYWLKKQSLSNHTIIELRSIAKRYRVDNFPYLTKEQLIHAIRIRTAQS